MMDRSVATYGEENRLWTGAEARAFSRVSAIPELLAHKASGVRRQASATDSSPPAARRPTPDA